MEISNKLKDMFKIKRVLTEEEIKDIASQNRQKTTMKILGVGIVGLTIYNYSDIVDSKVIEIYNFLLNYLNEHTFFMGVPISRGCSIIFIISLILLVLSFVYSEYIKSK